MIAQEGHGVSASEDVGGSVKVTQAHVLLFSRLSKTFLLAIFLCPLNSVVCVCKLYTT